VIDLRRSYRLVLASAMVVGYSCAGSPSVSNYELPAVSLGGHPAYWYAMTDTLFAVPLDSCLVTLTHTVSDSLVAPPWGSIPPHIELVTRSPIAVDFLTTDAKRHTGMIHDTLDAGLYAIHVYNPKGNWITMGIFTIAGERQRITLITEVP